MGSAPPSEIDPERCLIEQLGLRCPLELCTECQKKDGQSACAARQSDRHTSGHHCTTDRHRSRVKLSASAQSAWPLIQNVDWDERGLSEKHRDWKQCNWTGHHICQHSHAVASMRTCTVYMYGVHVRQAHSHPMKLP